MRTPGELESEKLLVELPVGGDVVRFDGKVRVLGIGRPAVAGQTDPAAGVLSKSQRLVLGGAHLAYGPYREATLKGLLLLSELLHNEPRDGHAAGNLRNVGIGEINDAFELFKLDGRKRLKKGKVRGIMKLDDYITIFLRTRSHAAMSFKQASAIFLSVYLGRASTG